MKTWILFHLERFWIKQNYAYCMSSAYLAEQRDEMVAAADWQTRADDWQLKLDMCGRRLYD